MLSVAQLRLLVHLKQYTVANREICTLFADDYSLRPLMRYKYISSNNGIYRLLKKGFEVTAHIQQLITIGGNAEVIERAIKTSRLAAIFTNMGIQGTGTLRANVFIPSNKWREIRQGITSTARFNGILCYKDMRLAVYDIGDGNMEWQAYAETSLFFRNYGTYENRATGMLLICDGEPLDIAEQILRHTISNRKALMKQTKLESDKKWSYSTGSIRLRPNYEKVYIADKIGIFETLRMAENEQRFVDYFIDKFHGTKGDGSYDIEVYPTRYFVNPQGDLLKFAKYYDTLKSAVKFRESMKDREFSMPDVKYHILISEKFEKLVKLYNLPIEYTVVDNNLIKEISNGTDN